jgi:hypothetical protein
MYPFGDFFRFFFRFTTPKTLFFALPDGPQSCFRGKEEADRLKKLDSVFENLDTEKEERRRRTVSVSGTSEASLGSHHRRQKSSPTTRLSGFQPSAPPNSRRYVTRVNTLPELNNSMHCATRATIDAADTATLQQLIDENMHAISQLDAALSAPSVPLIRPVWQVGMASFVEEHTRACYIF